MRLYLGRLAAAAFIVASGAVFGAPEVRAANLDEACGGPQKITCNSALFCRKAIGQCADQDAPGTCEKAPDFCIRISRPVCGCNGKTYPNECEARHVRMAIDYTGACKKLPASPDEKPASPPAKKKKKSGK
jgi:Kazal-type serine protease inhibitor domain